MIPIKIHGKTYIVDEADVVQFHNEVRDNAHRQEHSKKYKRKLVTCRHCGYPRAVPIPMCNHCDEYREGFRTVIHCSKCNKSYHSKKMVEELLEGN
jgi:hypothetical protein